MQRVLIDTDVILDLFLEREPFLSNAEQILLNGKQNYYRCCITATILLNVFYVVRKYRGLEIALQSIRMLLFNKDFQILSVDRKTLIAALDFGMKDFEDAVQASAAHLEKINLIVTRNLRDFDYSPVRAVSPEEFLAM